MAASTAMIVDPAVTHAPQADHETEVKPSVNQTGAPLAMPTTLPPAKRSSGADTPAVKKRKGTSPTSIAPQNTAKQPVVLAVQIESNEANESVAEGSAVANGGVRNTPNARSKQANALGIKTSKKKKGPAKRQKELPSAPSHRSVGLYVDALDVHVMWGNGKIVEVNEAEQKIKIAFTGFSSKWDIWTDTLSIRPYGTMTTTGMRHNVKGWDGRTNLITGERIAEADEVVMTAAPATSSALPKLAKAAVPKEVVKQLPPPPTVAQSSAASPPVPVAPSTLKKTTLAPSGAKKRKMTIEHRPGGTVVLRRVKVSRPTAPLTPLQATGPWLELAQSARESAEAIGKVSQFLHRCADLWQQQLEAMTAQDGTAEK